MGDHGDGPGGAFDGLDNVLAHTLGGPPPNNFGALAGDVHFDDSENWTDVPQATNAQPIDLVTVAAHEFGHVLGLNETGVAGSLMWPNYLGSHRFLGQDDIAGIQSLYGPPTNFILGAVQVDCSPRTFTLENFPAGTTLTWTVSGPIQIVGGQGTQNVQVQSTTTSPSTGTITATLASGCDVVTFIRTVTVGSPNLLSMTYGTQGSGTNNPANTVNFVSANTWYIIRSNANNANLTAPINWFFPLGQPGNVNGYTGGINNVDFNLNLSSGQSVTFNTIRAVNNCDAQTRNVTFTTGSGFRAYPNPAREEVTVEFDNPTYPEALPDALEIVSEKQMKTVRTVNVQDVFARKAFKNGKQIEFDIRDLPRGVYYLKVTNPRQEKDKQVEMVRLVFE